MPIENRTVSYLIYLGQVAFDCPVCHERKHMHCIGVCRCGDEFKVCSQCVITQRERLHDATCGRCDRCRFVDVVEET